jgi:hypothetical protein
MTRTVIFILILFLHLGSDLPSNFFPSGFYAKVLLAICFLLLCFPNLSYSPVLDTKYGVVTVAWELSGNEQVSEHEVDLGIGVPLPYCSV